MDHQDYMRLALQLAEGGKGQTSPNPAVGAVVVKEGRIVGLGAHLKAGEAHAEVHALNMAGEEADGSTVYVTLEPCSHHGKTPPCADLLIEKGVHAVFAAAEDPNSKVSGRGIAKLREAGIRVETGLLKDEATAVNEVFFHYIRSRMPYVRLKSAMSLDGKIATVNGESQWITGEGARRDGHRLRDETDAILVGVNTVIADNPSLTARLSGGGKNPVRIILDRHLRTPVDANVVTDGKAPTWIFAGQDAAEKSGERYRRPGVRVISSGSERVEIIPVLQHLGSEGIASLLVEGGAAVHASFLEEKAVQEVITYVAPKLIGGRSAPTPFAGAGVERLADALHLTIGSVDRIGGDIKIVSRPKEEDADVYGNR
ncbi:MAG TPA: bifunctional diaminohydroxyphosphoribosylaminopyrimidine deaminase/5-amino-6-(5-phosphoribosylamino)uracil reductase RibD [Bacillales bacterium]|nr:bifunctional diaminohydroxyphosphoribosylaminopyrimidine deaminase/5-amino-6-(5-phosphoribosylamino)uracil reductase RibD [Bacillales bacterium]